MIKRTIMNIVKELALQLRKGNAHVSFENAVDGIPFDEIHIKPANLPYSIWDLVEHIRITQWDILEFCRNVEHQSPEWPQGYWVAEKNPTEEEWKSSLAQIKSDREEMIRLLEKSDMDKLFETFPYGNGQSLFREALVIADHTAYHTGEIIVLRRLLGNWG